MSKKEKKIEEKMSAEADTTAESQQVQDLEGIEKDLEKARSEAADYLDSLQRLKAEFENFRKRMLKEQSAYLNMASQGLIIELLPVVANFERALAHAEQSSADDLLAGVQLLYNQLIGVLEKQGLKAIDPVGEEFDPTKQEAMMQVESDEHGENIVVEVFEKGYELKGQIIRPAKVKVAR